MIISEKPSSAKKIAESLADGKAKKKANGKIPYYELKRNGKDIVVGCAAGHLFTVAEKNKSNKYPSFDLEWKASAEASKSAAFSKPYLTTLKKLAKDANVFTVATDYDVEGEVIGLNIIKYIAKQKDARRMKFSTLTKEDLIESYENASPSLNWGQANAGETRHFLDWMYGINLSRALMESIKKAGSFKILSIGRVQGPALKILVDKELEIGKFVPVPYWQIKLSGNKDDVPIEAWHKGDKFWEKDKAVWFFGRAEEAKTAKVTKVSREEYKQPPPNPFDLGSLQSESYRQFRISPKNTLGAAQNLYSAGYISYPRTSSQQLDKKLGFKKILNSLVKNPDFKDIVNVIINGPLNPNNGKKKDPAHPAIYPTGTPPKSLKGYDEKVYDLIVKRFVATFGDWAVRETIKVELDANSEVFLTSGKRTIDKGWHDLYAPYLKQEETEMPELNENDQINIETIEFLEKQTEPPRRYSPASLIKELEKRELGTKATRADIIESLYKRAYVSEESIKATKMGMKIVETLVKYCPEIMDEKLTRHFEEEMEKIREDKMKKDSVLEESKKVLTKLLKRFDENQEKIGKDLQEAHIETRDEESYIGPCPSCDGSLTIKLSKKARKRFVACDKYPDCETTFPLPQTALVKTANKQCEQCNHPMLKLIRKGRRPQEACLNPDCPSKQVDESLIEQKTCPKCKKELILRKSVYGAFYGCSGYPKCRHTEKIEKKEK